jgi:hypothetical protein
LDEKGKINITNVYDYIYGKDFKYLWIFYIDDNYNKISCSPDVYLFSDGKTEGEYGENEFANDETNYYFRH